MFALFMLPLIVVLLTIRAFVLEPFNIPAGSMAPTLIVGDYVFVSKASYGYCRFSAPFDLLQFDGRIFASPPQRGDVAVFRLPKDPATSYVKRIVGLPGDDIQVRHGRLYLNGQIVARRPAGDYQYGAGPTAVEMQQYVEALPRGADGSTVEYRVLQFADDGPLDNTPVYHVPPGHYFTLGDNRDNSQDSRVLSAVGYIPEENLIGRAEFIYYSADRDGTARFDRVLQQVR